jgi:transcriptional regulator with XRE-family HTH domain
MTPFGARLRALRADRGVTLKALAAHLQVSAAYLSALEHGRRGVPSPGLVHQVNAYFGLIWDEAEAMADLARLSHPRVTVNTAGLTPEQTALANRLAQTVHRLPPETVAALHGILDEAPLQGRPGQRRAVAGTRSAANGSGKGVMPP